MRLTHKIAEGGEREVYAHPENSALVVKIMKPTARFNRNMLELGYFKVAPQLVLEHIAPVHGAVVTDRGRGIVCDFIHDAEGRPCPTLGDAVKSGLLTLETAINLLFQFFEWATQNRVPICDASPDNFLVQFRGDEPHLVMIDGFGPGGRNLKWWLRLRFRRLLMAKNAKAYKKVSGLLSV